MAEAQNDELLRGLEALVGWLLSSGRWNPYVDGYSSLRVTLMSIRPNWVYEAVKPKELAYRLLCFLQSPDSGCDTLLDQLHLPTRFPGLKP